MDSEYLRLSKRISKNEKALAAIKLAIYPVGSIYTSVDSTSPATLFGGTWAAFAQGKVLVGYAAGDADFNTVEQTSGSKTNTIGQTNLPNIEFNCNAYYGAGTGGNLALGGGSVGLTQIKALSGGSATPLNNIQPSITVYMWKRTA